MAVALFVAVIIVVFHRAIFFGEVLAPLDLLSKELPWGAVLPKNVHIQNFTLADGIATFYPWWHFVHEELQAGRFPLWCTHVGCGFPVVGEGQINLFGLTTPCLWIAPPRIALILTFSTQLLAAMAGMYALLCSLRVRWSAALFGALIFGLNSRIFQDLELNCTIGAWAILPWICWALWEGLKREHGRGRFYSLAGLFYGLAILNGSLQSHVIVWLPVAGFAVAAVWRQRRARFIRESLKAIMTFSVLGVCIGAMAWLPNLELLTQNTRKRFNQIEWPALMLQRPLAVVPCAAAMVNPDAIGNSETFDLLHGLGHPGTGATMPGMADLRLYCGLIAVVLAFFGLRARSDAKCLAVVLILVPVIVGFITPLYLILYFRSLAPIPVGIAILAGLGLERFWQPDKELARDVRNAVVILLAAIGLALCVGGVVNAKRAAVTKQVEQIGSKKTSFYKADVAWQRQKAEGTVANFTLKGRAVLRFSLLALLTVGLLVMARLHKTVAVAFLIFNTADLVGFSWRTVPSVPPAFEYPQTPALDFLQQQKGTFRVASTWNAETDPPTARENMLMMHGLNDPRIYDSLIPKNPLLKANNWDALNVRYFIVPPAATPPAGEWRLRYSREVDIYENLRVEPRVCFAAAPSGLDSQTDWVQIESYVAGRIRVHVNAPQEGWLIVRERLYPGWRATVNGRPTPLVEAQGLWQAVPVSAGSSFVELKYLPASFGMGAALSLTGILLVVMLCTPHVSNAARTALRFST